MKPASFLVLAISLPAIAVAAPAELFAPQTLPSIPLSLLDSAHAGKLPTVRVPDFTDPLAFHRAPKSKFYSAMPVVRPPRDSLDPKFVVPPDSSIDYKLLIIRPEVTLSGRVPKR